MQLQVLSPIESLSLCLGARGSAEQIGKSSPPKLAPVLSSLLFGFSSVSAQGGQLWVLWQEIRSNPCSKKLQESPQCVHKAKSRSMLRDIGSQISSPECLNAHIKPPLTSGSVCENPLSPPSAFPVSPLFFPYLFLSPMQSPGAAGAVLSLCS